MKKILFILIGVLAMSANIYANSGTKKVRITKFAIKGIEIPVIYEEDKSLPRVMMQLQFDGAGSINDGNKKGLSYISASLLNEGTKMLGGQNFALELEKRAISLSAETSFNSLSFYVNFLTEQKSKAISLLKDLLKDPNLTQESLNLTKTKAISTIKINNNDFDYLASIGLNAEIFANTPLATPTIGNIKSIDAMNLNDVREFLNNRLTLANLTILIGGDIDIDSTLQELRAVLENLNTGTKEKVEHFTATDAEKSKTRYEDTEQAYIYFASPLDLKDLKSEMAKVKIMFFILGSGGFGTRLMEDIRVKNGLAYSIYMRSSISINANTAKGYMQTAPKNEEKAIELIKKNINKFIKDGVTQQELDDAKNFLLGSEPLRKQTLDQRLGNALSYYNLGLDIDYSKSLLDEIANMKLEDLNRYIKSHKEIEKLSFYIITKEKK